LSGASLAQQSEPEPRLILVLAIDQMRFDYLSRFDDLYEGGLRTLLDEGAVFTNARYRHAVTETGPGHAVILSGRHPRNSGIIGNAWFDSFLGRSVNVVDDPFQQPLGGAGRSASPVNLVGFTLGDALKRISPGSKVVSVSLKDRAAILMAGRRGDAAYWYETAGGQFITSTYYMDAAESWLERWNQAHVADQYAGKQWTRLLPDLSVYERYAGPDDVEGERDRIDTVFPHDIRGHPPEPRFYDDLRRTPFADAMTLEVALGAMEAHGVGTDRTTDILAIGFSATDIIGHTYGADSQEVMDHLLRLDLLLGELFDEIDDRVGLANTVVVLTADHGSMPLVENLRASGINARRVDTRLFLDAVNSALEAGFDDASGIVSSFGNGVYLDTARVRERGISRFEVEETVIEALMDTGLVAAVYTQAQLLSDDPSNDPYLRLYRNSFFSSRSPHLSIRFKEHLYLGPYIGGTGHGSPYDYDRHVPIVLMGPQIRPGSYPKEAGPTDIAPTLAAILGLEYPREPDARILSEALR